MLLWKNDKESWSTWYQIVCLAIMLFLFESHKQMLSSAFWIIQMLSWLMNVYVKGSIHSSSWYSVTSSSLSCVIKFIWTEAELYIHFFYIYLSKLSFSLLCFMSLNFISCKVLCNSIFLILCCGQSWYYHIL